MSRLRKLKKSDEKRDLMYKTASHMMDISSEALKSGDVIGISARTVNWKPWYQVYLEYGSGTSSFYDGPDVNRAFDMYKDLLIAFKGVSVAEQFSKQIPIKIKQLEQYMGDPRRNNVNQYFHNLTYKAPGFLGFPS